MKASREWLEEYSDIDVDTIKLGDILTMTGSKVESLEQRGRIVFENLYAWLEGKPMRIVK